jgi:hypothetical protein
MLESSDCYVPPPCSGPTVLSIGEFHPIKGQILLAKASLQVLEEMPEVRFVMIGKEGMELAKAKKLISDADKEESFILPGQVPVGMDTYRSATITVVPSIYEGFGLVAFESMNAGTPTLVSDGGALKEIVGDAAHIFPSGDTTQFARAILQILRDKKLRDRLKIMGPERVKQFPREQFVKSYLDLYYRVLNLSSAARFTP